MFLTDQTGLALQTSDQLRSVPMPINFITDEIRAAQTTILEEKKYVGAGIQPSMSYDEGCAAL